jgi:hypothetical protein
MLQSLYNIVGHDVLLNHIVIIQVYTPILIAKAYWEDVDMDVMLGLPRSPRNKDSVVVVVDPF